ncbi:MAG: ankyrin repeat domain-containing protein [Candidatus Amoebophilus sp.]
MERGADVNIKEAYGYTPLHVAAYRTHVGLFKLLLEHGTSIYAHNDK